MSQKRRLIDRVHRHPFVQRVFVAALTLVTGSLALADTAPPSQFSTEIGIGYEAQSSPLIRISPQGQLISIDGMQQFGSPSLRVGVQGFANWQFENGLGLSLAGDVSQKQNPGSEEFGFGSASVQTALHWPLPLGSLGLGLSFQHVEVASRPFRDIRSMQLDWTVADADASHWALVVEAGSNRHPDEFSNQDATTGSLVLQRHVSKPWAGFDALDLSAYLSRERNERGLDELSFLSLMMAATLQWDWQGVTWSAGATLQNVQFADATVTDEPQRVDRAVGIEFGGTLELSPKHTLRVEYSHVRNMSTLPMYDNNFQQVGVKLRSVW